MAVSLTPLIGIDLNTPTPPGTLNGYGTNVGPMGPEGITVMGSNNRRYTLAQATTAIPVGTSTCLLSYPSNGNVNVAASGGTAGYAIDLGGVTGTAAAIGDFVWISGAQGTP